MAAMKTNVHKQILDMAEMLIQTQGYNAFSFRHIAKIIGIKTSSIHYYFPTKAELCTAVIARHINILCDQLDSILKDNAMNCKEKIRLFLDSIFSQTYASNHKMCLGGMLASDVLTLPEAIQMEVRKFFNRLEDWLAQLLLQGIASKDFRFAGNAKQEAEFILSVLEGSLLLARLYKNEGKLLIARQQIEERLF